MKQVLAIDGPSGTGKSTVAKALAKRLGWTYLDTGAMYRAVTHAWLEAGADPARLDDEMWLASLNLDFDGSRMLLNGEDISTSIRGEAVTKHVSQVSAKPAVREFLTGQQRAIGSSKPCVLEGRDIGTVVFPDAFFKVFLTASAEVRAQRRWLQLGGESAEQSKDEIQADLERRDRSDQSRAVAPLRQAEDAFVLDTDDLSEEAVIDRLLQETERRLQDE